MAKQDTASIVSGGNLFLGIMAELARAVRRLGGSAEDLRRLVSPGGKQTILEMARLAVGRRAEALRVTVDYGASLGDMIQAGGYDWANPEIAVRHFPILGSGVSEVDVVPVHLDRPVSTERALAELDGRGLRPALLEELLAFGARYPDKQREFPIVALGSIWRSPGGHRGVVYLYGQHGRRELVLRWIEGDWGEHWRFAAVRK